MNLAALATARRIGDRSFECYCAGNVAYRRLLTGDWAEDRRARRRKCSGPARTSRRTGTTCTCASCAWRVLRGELDGGDRPPGSTRRTSGFGDFEADALCQVADATVALAGDQASAAHEHAVAVLDETAQLGGCHEADP